MFDGSKEVNTNFTNSVATALNHFIQTGEYATGYCNNSNQISAYAGVYETCFVPISENTNYHISSQASENNGFSSINILDKNGNLLQSSNNWVGAGYAFTTPSNAKYLMFGTRIVNIDYIQLIKGTTSIPLVPHKEQVLPLTLGNIELCKIGDYQDYFYKESNKWYLHKEIGKVVLDGTQTYNADLSVPSQGRYDFLIENALLRGLCLSNYFKYEFAIRNGNIFISGSTANDICIINTSITIKAEMLTWLDTNKPVVYYQLATPTDTEITDTTLISQLEAINNAISYEEQTNISSNTIALFSVEAYQSTKLLLENIESRLTLVEG